MRADRSVLSSTAAAYFARWPGPPVAPRTTEDLVEIGTARGDEAITIQRPFPVTLVPARLVVP